MQTTLLGLAIAMILALVAALIAPLVVDWNHYRSAFEAEASRMTGLSVRVNGTIDARILPTPLIKLRDVEIGQAGGEPQMRVGALELEVRLGPLLRGEVQASEAHLVAPQITLGLDSSGAIDWPALRPSFRPEELSVSRLSVEDGRVTLADASSGSRLVLQKISFAGNIRSLAGPFAGEGTFVVGDEPYRYRLSGGHADDGGGLKIRLGVDPSNHPLTTDVDGTLTFDRGVPQFDGTFALARPVGATLSSGKRVMNDPWQVQGRIRATTAAAALEHIAFQYGPDERAINFTGKANLTFGEHPHFAGEISALEVDVDRALADPDVTHRPPLLVIKSFFEAFVAAAKLPIPGEVGIGIDGLTVGGTTIQSLHGALRSDATGWSLNGVDLRAPGFTQVNLSGRLKDTPQGLAFIGPAAIESADLDTLLAWLGGRSGQPSGDAKTFKARGDVTISGDQIAVDQLTASLNSETVEGRLAYTWPVSGRPAIVDADLHATNLDLDALTTFVKASVDADIFALPHQGSLALDIGRATLAGVDARAVKAQLKFDAGALQIDRLSVADLGGAALDVRGRIDELSSQPRGRVTLDLDAAAGLPNVVGRFAPRAENFFRRLAGHLGPAKVHAVISVEHAATAGSTAKLDLDGQMGLMRLGLHGNATGEPSHLGDAIVHIESRLDADDGTALAALFGLDHVVGVDQLPGSMTVSAAGPLNGDLRVDSQVSASGFEVVGRGTLRLSGEQGPKGAFQVLASAADLRPLQQALTGQPGAAVPVSARAAVAIAGSDLSFTQMAVAVGKTHVQGHVALHLATPIGIDGDVAADEVDAAHAAAMLLGLPSQAPGAAETWSSAPVGAGAFSAMNGAVTFKLDRAALTQALVARDLKGVARFQTSHIALDEIDGSLAGGRVTGALTFMRDADGLVSHGHVELAGADAATFEQSDKKVVDGRLSLKLDGDSIGASPAAIVRSLHGGGAISLKDAHFAGLDASAFDAAIGAADREATIAPAKIQAAVTAAMENGRVAVLQGDAAITLTSGNLGVANVTLQAQDGAALALAGVLDLGDAAIDARMTLSANPPAHALIRLRPELAVAIKGPLAAPVRTLDIAALASWLTLRSAELQTRRLESIEANRRNDVLGQAIRPDSPVVRPAPGGTLIESGIQVSVPGGQTPGAQGERLRPDVPAAGAVTGPAVQSPPKSAPPSPAPQVLTPQVPMPQPAAPNTAGAEKRSPFDFLFRSQN